MFLPSSVVRGVGLLLAPLLAALVLTAAPGARVGSAQQPAPQTQQPTPTPTSEKQQPSPTPTQTPTPTPTPSPSPTPSPTPAEVEEVERIDTDLTSVLLSATGQEAPLRQHAPRRGRARYGRRRRAANLLLRARDRRAALARPARGHLGLAGEGLEAGAGGGLRLRPLGAPPRARHRGRPLLHRHHAPRTALDGPTPRSSSAPSTRSRFASPTTAPSARTTTRPTTCACAA
jgi:hypothetical protein